LNESLRSSDAWSNRKPETFEEKRTIHKRSEWSQQAQSFPGGCGALSCAGEEVDEPMSGKL
jgi:hypothetical protein